MLGPKRDRIQRKESILDRTPVSDFLLKGGFRDERIFDSWEFRFICLFWSPVLFNKFIKETLCVLFVYISLYKLLSYNGDLPLLKWVTSDIFCEKIVPWKKKNSFLYRCNSKDLNGGNTIGWNKNLIQFLKRLYCFFFFSTIVNLRQTVNGILFVDHFYSLVIVWLSRSSILKIYCPS